MDQIFGRFSDSFLRSFLTSYAATITLVTHPFSSGHIFFWELVCRVSVHHLVNRLTPLLTARFSPALWGLRKRPTHVVLSFIAIFVGEGRTTYTRGLRFYNDNATARAFTTNFISSRVLGLSLPFFSSSVLVPFRRVFFLRFS